MVRARDVKMMPDDHAYDQAMLLNIRGTPNNPVAAAQEDDGGTREIPRIPRERPEEPISHPVPLRVIIRRSYLDRFGYTRGSKVCEAILRGDDGGAF